jgi:hypothetical protein
LFSLSFFHLTVIVSGIEAVVLSDVALTVKLTVEDCGSGVWPRGDWLEPEPHPATTMSSPANPSETAGCNQPALLRRTMKWMPRADNARAQSQMFHGNVGNRIGARRKFCAVVLPARSDSVTWVGPLPAETVTGLNVQFHPAGIPEQENAIADARAPAWPTVSGKVAVLPLATVAEVCVAVNEIPFTTCVSAAEVLPAKLAGKLRKSQGPWGEQPSGRKPIIAR